MTLTFVTPLITAWVLLNNVVTELTLRASVWFTINLPMLIPAPKPAVIPMAVCFKTNNLFTKGAFGRLSDLLGGGIAGLAFEIVWIVVGVAMILAMIFSLTKHGPEWLKNIVGAPRAIIFGIGIMILLRMLLPMLNNGC